MSKEILPSYLLRIQLQKCITLLLSINRLLFSAEERPARWLIKLSMTQQLDSCNGRMEGE